MVEDQKEFVPVDKRLVFIQAIRQGRVAVLSVAFMLVSF